MGKDEEQLQDIKPIELMGILSSIPITLIGLVNLAIRLGIPEFAI